MSGMAPLDAGSDLSIRGFGQASGAVRARRGVAALAGFVAVRGQSRARDAGVTAIGRGGCDANSKLVGPGRAALNENDIDDDED